MLKHTTLESELLSAVKELPKDKIAEVVDFACYFKLKGKIKEKEDFDVWAEKLADKKGFNGLTEDEAAKLVMECRGKTVYNCKES